jgi:dihydrofolate reductase
MILASVHNQGKSQWMVIGEIAMGKITAFINLTLDGVMQAPGRPDEDTRGGFTYGGWAVPYMAMGSGAQNSDSGGLLLGRRTYEDFYAVWPGRTDNPFTAILDNAQKYVASSTLKEPLPWVNSTLLKGDIPTAVADLKKKMDKDLVILGSGVLIQSLIAHKLVDIYTLLIHPLALGSGRKLFVDGGPYAALKLVDSKTTPTGVVIATYQPAELGLSFRWVGT